MNYLNIGLMALALAAALLLPFEVFLLSYAVLGPLHYLTQISWLHDKGYFTPRRLDWTPLIVLGVLGFFFMPGVFGPEPFVRLSGEVGQELYDWRYDPAFVACGVALAMVVTRSTGARLLIVAATFGILEVFRGDYVFISIFAVYLPTIVHVTIFTALFILWGALKSRSTSGHVSLGVLLACTLACFLAPPLELRGVTEWGTRNFIVPIQSLTISILVDFVGVERASAERMDLFHDPAGVSAVRYLAFAYTYHYLNWFSKTSIIRWHEIPRSRAAGILAVWVASIGLYVHDYALGLSWLFLLSFSHVLLEFPLNYRSVHGIALELRSRFAS